MSIDIKISQSVAILIDGNNIERSLHAETGDTGTMINFDTLIPRLIGNRSLNRLTYFREGANISSKLAERLHDNFHGSVIPCHKTADIPLAIKATQLASKVDTIIIMSGDSDYVDLVKYLRNEGVRVEIAAVPKTTAEALRNEADYFHAIQNTDWFSLSKSRSNTGNTGSKTERISQAIINKGPNKQPAKSTNTSNQNQASKPSPSKSTQPKAKTKSKRKSSNQKKKNETEKKN